MEDYCIKGSSKTHQGRLNHALRTHQVCRLGRTVDHLATPNSLNLVPGDAYGANTTKTQRKHINASRRLQGRLENISKIANDHTGAYLSNIHPFKILTITRNLILQKTQATRPFSHQNLEISSPVIVRDIKPVI